MQTEESVGDCVKAIFSEFAVDDLRRQGSRDSPKLGQRRREADGNLESSVIKESAYIDGYLQGAPTGSKAPLARVYVIDNKQLNYLIFDIDPNCS